MRITVGICTWNRASLLAQTLEHMCYLHVPDDVEWEVLVVDNNCTDGTGQVLADFTNRLPLRCLVERTPGKSFALNSAVQHINAELVIWTDDDVVVDAGWLAAYAEAAKTHPDAAFFGGPIDPWFETPPPPWLEKSWSRVSMAYALRTCKPGPSAVERDSLPFGANLAIRTEVQRRYPYDTRLGRVGSGQRRGEETELIERMLDDGVTGLWWPDARVRHFIPRSRISELYLRRFYYGIGQTDAALENDPDSLAAKSRRGPTLALAKAVFAEMRFQCTRRVCPPARWVKDLTKCSYYWGRRAG